MLLEALACCADRQSHLACSAEARYSIVGLHHWQPNRSCGIVAARLNHAGHTAVAVQHGLTVVSRDDHFAEVTDLPREVW